MFVDLLLKRLKAYGFWDKSLALMCSYLENRKQGIQINNYFSSEKKVIAGVPQGSINGLLLFDLFINDHALFLTQCFLSTYADNNNLYSTGNNTELAKMDLQTDFRAITNWFFENDMILNSEKCHYMSIRRNCADDIFIHNGKEARRNSKEETILGVIIDNKLTFDSHLNRMCKKASQKLSALSWISAFIDLNKRQILFQSMIKLQFSCCPLTWMFYSRESNNLIKKVHERSTCFIVAATFLQFPILWNFQLFNFFEFSTCEFKWQIWTDLKLITEKLCIN